MAAAMRAKTLDQLEREADAANANLAGPTIGFVVTMVVRSRKSSATTR